MSNAKSAICCSMSDVLSLCRISLAHFIEPAVLGSLTSNGNQVVLYTLFRACEDYLLAYTAIRLPSLWMYPSTSVLCVLPLARGEERKLSCIVTAARTRFRSMWRSSASCTDASGPMEGGKTTGPVSLLCILFHTFHPAVNRFAIGCNR